MLRSIKSTQRAVRQLELAVLEGSINLSIDDDQVDPCENTFTAVDHGLKTGDRIKVEEGDTLPNGLTNCEKYWVIKVDKDTFKLAYSLSEALNDCAINISDNGCGENYYNLMEELAGPASLQALLYVHCDGIYKIVFNKPFAQAPIAVGNILGVDKVLTVGHSCLTEVTLKVNAIDECPELKNGQFHVLVIGTDVNEKN